jgi:TrmH family RNA methyltransferase
MCVQTWRLWWPPGRRFLISSLGLTERGMLDEPESGRVNDLAQFVPHLMRLQSSRAYRDTCGAFFVEGVRNIVQAIESGWPVATLIYSDRLAIVPIARRLVRERRRQGTPCLSVSPEEFRRVSQGERASGVAAVVSQRWCRLHKESPRAGLCWVALGAVRSPGNLGTLIRSSEAVGGAGFILVGTDVDPFDPAAVRASMGAVFRQRFVRTTGSSLLNWVRRHGCHVIGATPEGATEYHRFHFPGPTVLLLGEERKGLSAEQRLLCAQSVRIPMVGRADSLNVAVAGTLLLYEVYRARERARLLARNYRP